MFSPRGPTLLELLRQALSSTDEGYDLLAPKFDETPFRTPQPVLDAVSVGLGSAPAATGVDLACGTGAGVGLLRGVCRERVVGVDRSQGMLRVARATLAGEGPPVELLRGDVRALPFGAAFEVATCFGAFGHIEEQDEAAFVAEVKRILLPGGRFVFVTADAPRESSPAVWIARGFNLAMRVRNLLFSPPFVMTYLTFLLPRARALLEAEGFRLEVSPLQAPHPYHRLLLVVATRA